MNIKNVVFVIDEVAGGTTYFDHIEKAMEYLPYIKPYFFRYAHKNFLKANIKQIPFYKGWVKPFRASYLSNALFSDKFPKKIDAFFFFSFELPISYNVAHNTPSIVAFDGTLIDSFRLKMQFHNNTLANLECFLKWSITKFPLLKMTKNIDYFLPLTTWCKNSLINDFNVDPEKIVVAPGGYDTSVWKPINRTFNTSNKKKLLFVGNDFIRKGGKFLIELFSTHLSSNCELTIISNDAFFKDYSVPKGINVISGIRDFYKIIPYYQEADLFLLPTQIEWMGHVLIEASLTGVPIVATDVGGVSEIVKDEYNGYLLPLNATVTEWMTKVEKILTNESLWSKMRKNTLKLAESNFTREIFVQRVKTAFNEIGIKEE